MSKIYNDAPSLIGENTQAQVFNQNITYSNPGITYSNIGIAYGGVYNAAQDIIPTISLAENVFPIIASINDEGQGFTIPMMSLAENIKPIIYGYTDIYTNNTPPPPNNQKVVGLGWWMYVAQV